MYFGSPFYILMLVLLVGTTAGGYYFLRFRSVVFQCEGIFAFMVINTLQHFFKFLIYPPYYGMGFTLYSTAYNMCSVLIILSPLALLSGSRFLKNFVFFVGAAAGLGAISFPFWFFGMPVKELGWEYIRFYICHALLFLTSVLPLLLGIHKPMRWECWQIGTGFILALCLILVNNAVFMSMGLFPGNSSDLYTQLLSVNPCMLMGPKEGFEWLTELLQVFSPSVLLGNNPAGHYAPILWYALPVFVGISLIAYVLFSLLEQSPFSHPFNEK